MHLAVKSRRGMTLAEIMVALGMVAIMIVMVVSFVLLLSNRTQNNNALQSIQQDRQHIQAGVENWMDAVAGQPLACDGNTVTADGKTLQFAHGQLTGQLGDTTIRFRAETVERMEFTLYRNDADYLLLCTVTARNAATEETLTYTFCVNPRLGEGGAA